MKKIFVLLMAAVTLFLTTSAQCLAAEESTSTEMVFEDIELTIDEDGNLLANGVELEQFMKDFNKTYMKEYNERLDKDYEARNAKIVYIDGTPKLVFEVVVLPNDYWNNFSKFLCLALITVMIMLIIFTVYDYSKAKAKEKSR